MKRSSIKKKFITTFLLIAILIFIVYSVTFYIFKQTLSEYEQLIKNADIANRIPSMYTVLIDDFKNYLVESNKEYEKFQNSITKIEELVSYIKNNTSSYHNNSIAQLEGISNQLKIIKIKTNNAIKYRREGNLEKANKEFYELSDLSDFLRENISQYISKELSYSVESREQIHKKSIILGLLSTFLIFFITILGLLYGIRLSQMTVNAILQISNRDILDEDIKKEYKEEELVHLNNQFVKLQKNIKESIKQLYESENRISSILNGMYDCVLTISENKIILSCNYAVENVFGYKSTELIGKNIEILIPDINKIFTNNSADKHIEFSGLRRDSSNFPLEIGFSKIEQNNEEIFILVIHDITQHKEVERMKSEFVSIVSHELRTPLTAIKGSLELMMCKDITELSETAYNLTNISYESCVRLISIINDILDIEKISAGKMNFNYEVLELSSIIKNTIIENSSLEKQYNIKFMINGNLPEFKVNVDKNRIIQVLTNLLSNAAKYSPTDNNVEITLFKHNDYIRTSVKNYGPPIDEDFKQQIFQKFTQADSSVTRKKGGTGLGLSICKNIIDCMNGNISFESNEKETVFYFDIPEYKQCYIKN